MFTCSPSSPSSLGLSFNSLPGSVHWRFLMKVTFNSLDFFLGRHAWTCHIPSNRRISETYTPEKLLRWNVGKKHDFQNCSCKKPPIVSFEVLGQAHTPSQCPHQISTPETKVAVHGEETHLTAAPAFQKKRVGRIDETHFLGCQISDHVIKWAFTKLTFDVYVDHFDPIKE